MTRRDLRAFLDMVGYYRRFIPGFAGRAGPLFAALKKGSPDQLCGLRIFPMHTTTCLMLFVPLCLPRSSDHLTLYTDASYGGLGAVL